jgi:hypothetical protein
VEACWDIVTTEGAENPAKEPGALISPKAPHSTSLVTSSFVVVVGHADSWTDGS